MFVCVRASHLSFRLDVPLHSSRFDFFYISALFAHVSIRCNATRHGICRWYLKSAISDDKWGHHFAIFHIPTIRLVDVFIIIIIIIRCVPIVWEFYILIFYCIIVHKYFFWFRIGERMGTAYLLQRNYSIFFFFNFTFKSKISNYQVDLIETVSIKWWHSNDL